MAEISKVNNGQSEVIGSIPVGGCFSTETNAGEKVFMKVHVQAYGRSLYACVDLETGEVHVFRQDSPVKNVSGLCLGIPKAAKSTKKKVLEN